MTRRLVLAIVGTVAATLLLAGRHDPGLRQRSRPARATEADLKRAGGVDQRAAWRQSGHDDRRGVRPAAPSPRSAARCASTASS